uniref:Cation channel sperm associated 2 n=1 Tax=Sphenodon punctatus TaxID=8508 RepID=A0A8D0HA00_SPHPU
QEFPQDEGRSSFHLLPRADAVRSKLIYTFYLIDHLQGLSHAVPRHNIRDFLDPRKQRKLMLSDHHQLVRFNINPARNFIITPERRWNNRLQVRCSRWPPLPMWVSWVLNSKTFQIFIISLIFLNMLALMIRRGEEGAGTSQGVFQVGLLPQSPHAPTCSTRCISSGSLAITLPHLPWERPESRSQEGPCLILLSAPRDLANSPVTVFILFTTDHWYTLLQDTWKIPEMNRAISGFYIIIWLLIGSFVFRNIFVAIMVTNFKHIRSDLTEEVRKIETQQKADLFKIGTKTGAAPGWGWGGGADQQDRGMLAGM